MLFLVKLICLILLGILSGILSYYNKNYYVRIFNDIMGTEEDERPAVRVGRGFLYGFLFPIYFALVLIGLIALVAFLIAAGIIAAIVFVLVWITEKILPHEFFGKPLLDLFAKLGLKPAVVRAPTIQAPPAVDAPAEEAPKDKPEGPSS